MKKILSTILAGTMLLLTLTACDSTNETPQNSGDITVGVVQYVSHPSLDNCFEGIEQALTSSGMNITIDRQVGSDASPDGDCATYSSAMVSKGYDMIVAIATPAAIPAYAATEGTDIPTVFCAVSDPVAAELVASFDEPGDTCTGTSDVLDLSAQLNMIKTFQPDVKKIGVLYTTSEANSITQLATLKELCAKEGIEVVASGVQNASDIPSAATALAGEVDCINNFTDNNVVNNLSVVIDVANSAGIPVYGSEEEQVKNGCLASMSIDYVALGNVTGQMAVDILNGANPATMAVKTISEATAVVNSDVLGAFNMTLPQEYADALQVTTNK